MANEARAKIEELKNRVKKRQRGSVIVDSEGNLHDPEKERNTKGTKVKSIVHGS